MPAADTSSLPALPKLPAPPSRESTLHIAESQSVVRERRFPPDIDISHVLAEIRRQKSVGTLMLDISDGVVGGVRFREEKKF